MEASMVVNIIETLNALWDPIKIVGLLIGYLLVGIGLFCFAMSMDKSKNVSLYASLMMMIAGFLLVSLDAFLSAASFSLIEQSSDLATLGYSSADTSSAKGRYTALAFALIKFLGLIAGIKGIYTLYSQADDRSQSIFTAIMFLGIAVIGLNFPHFLDMMGATLGGSVETSIDRVLQYSGQ